MVARRVTAAEAREMKRLARHQLERARVALRDARKALKERVRELRADCKARRLEERQRAHDARASLLSAQRAQRDALRAELTDARRALRTKCHGSREEARQRVRDAERRLRDARATVAWYASQRHSSTAQGMTAVERREHERDEARNNISDRDELELFDKLTTGRASAWKIRSTPRMSLTEAFYQYVHDHPALAESRYARELADLERLEREERDAWREHERALRRGPRSRVPMGDPAVIASAEGAGADAYWTF